MGIFFSIIFYLNFICIIFVLFFERNEDSRRMAWILTMVFLPGIGMVLYILLSGHFFTRTRQLEKIMSHATNINKKYLDAQLNFLKSNKNLLKNPSLTDNIQLLEMNLSKNYSLLTSTETIKVYCWGQDMLADLKQDLLSAKESIHIESFIIHNDKTGQEVMDILCKKAKEGISVKLLYDDVGSILTPTRFFRKLDQAGGVSLAFFPVRWRLPLSINFRNHRKITIIDGKIAYTGGMNIGDEYANCSKNKRKPLWRDTHVRLTGSSVLSLQINFLIDWFTTPAWKTRIRKLTDLQKYFSSSVFAPIQERLELPIQESFSKHFIFDKNIPTQIVTGGPDNLCQAEIREALIRIISNAKEYVYIQTPYFTPDLQFISALKTAIFSGVDIKIMVPDKWDKFYVQAASYEFIREMLDLGIEFYHYNGFIHSKTLVSDDKITTIGSTNIDTRSFELHFEKNVVFYDKNFAIKNKEIFIEDMKNSRQTEKKWFDSKNIIKRAWWAFCKLFSPLM